MAKYSRKAQEKVNDVMHEKKKGKLKSGSGQKVTSRKQAIAIALSEAREDGAKVPKKKAANKQAKKKSSPKKAVKKNSAVKKTAEKKSGVKKAATKKSVRKKAAKKSALK